MPIRKRRWAFGCLSVIAIVFAYRMIAVYRFRSHPCEEIAGTGQLVPSYPPRLTVLTYNIQGHASFVRGDHIDKIADAILQAKPDIVTINEAHRWTWQSRFRDHVATLRARTHMNGSYGASYRLFGGQFGNLVLTRGTIVSTKVHELPGTGEPRTLLEVLVRIDGGLVNVFVTHTTAWRDLNRATRVEQLACIARHLRASRYPFIVAGDLNAPPDAPEIRDFDTMNAAKPCGGSEPTHKVMGDRLDYVYAADGWGACDGRVLDIGPSDHRPVLATLVAPGGTPHGQQAGR